MSDAPRKAKRRWLVAPYILAVLIAAVWSLYWLSGKSKIEAGLEDQARALKASGFEAAWSAARVSGYPFRYFVTLKDARIKRPGGWGASAAYLEAEAAAYRPDVIALSAPQGFDLTRPDGSALRVTGQVLRMSIGGYNKTPPRLSAQGIKVVIAPQAGGPAPAFTAIETFEFHLRPNTGDTAQVSIRLDKATASSGTLGQIAAGQPVTLALEGTASKGSALTGSSWPALVQGWAAAGGLFTIHQGGLSAGPAELTVKSGEITADADGLASGKVRLQLAKPSDSMLALGAIGVLPDETAAVAAGLAAIGGSSATLHFSGGKTLIGPLPLGPAPRLY